MKPIQIDFLKDKATVKKEARVYPPALSGFRIPDFACYK